MNEEEYFLLIDGETSGPHTLEQLQELWFSKGIPLDTLYARPGLKECLPIDTLLEKIIAYKKHVPEPKLPPPPPPPEVTRKWLATYWAVVVLLVVFLWSIAPFITKRFKPANVVNATVQTSAIRMTLTNNDGEDWTEKIISLNDSPPQGYQCRLNGLRAGATLNISLIDFINPEGLRFQPWNMTVTEVWIGGGGKEFKRFRIVPK